MSTEFELWDSKTHNLLQFDRLDEAIRALRSLIRSDGEDAVIGLSLDAVSADGTSRMTLAEGRLRDCGCVLESAPNALRLAVGDAESLEDHSKTKAMT